MKQYIKNTIFFFFFFLVEMFEEGRKRLKMATNMKRRHSLKVHVHFQEPNIMRTSSDIYVKVARRREKKKRRNDLWPTECRFEKIKIRLSSDGLDINI